MRSIAALATNFTAGFFPTSTNLPSTKEILESIFKVLLLHLHFKFDRINAFSAGGNPEKE